MQGQTFSAFAPGKAEDIIGTLEKFKPQSCSNLLIYVNQYAFLKTVFFFFKVPHLAAELGNFLLERALIN